MNIDSKEAIQESQYYFPYHYLTTIENGAINIFKHLFWGLEHYTYISAVIDELRKHPNKQIIDIGCGEGRIISELLKSTNQDFLVGIDISDRAISFAKSFTESENFHVHNIVEKPFGNSDFDIAISCEVIEHIEPNDITKYVKNIASTLAVDGKLFLTTPTTNIKLGIKHYQHFTEDSLKQYLQPYFEIEKVYFLNRKTIGEKIINRILANRFYVSNYKPLNRILLKVYEKRYLHGNSKDSSRIFIVANKTGVTS